MRLPRFQRSVCASSHTLAIVISSFAPGAAATKYWNACECPSTFSAVPPTCLPSHSSSACCGSIVIAHRSGASSTSCSGRTPWRWNARDIRSCSATSQTIVRRPVCAAASPSAAATVVFPTPPLPGDVQQRPIPQQCVHRSHPMTMGRPARGVRDVAAHAAPPRPDVLPRHAQAAGRRPSRHIRALRLRAHRRSARRRPAPPADARRAPRRAGRLGGRARRRRATRSRARSTTPPPATRCRSASCAPVHALDARSTARARSGSPPGTSSQTYMDGSAGTVGRIMAVAARPPAALSRRPRPPRRRRSSSPTSSATSARTGGWTASTCPPRTASASASPTPTSPRTPRPCAPCSRTRSSAPARCSRPPGRRSRPRPAFGAPGGALRGRPLRPDARPRRGGWAAAASAARRACACGTCPGAALEALR